MDVNYHALRYKLVPFLIKTDSSLHSCSALNHPLVKISTHILSISEYTKHVLHFICTRHSVISCCQQKIVECKPLFKVGKIVFVNM